MANDLTAEEQRRLDSWAVSIVAALRPDAPMAETPGGAVFGNRGSLKLTSGAGWFDHEMGLGGRGTLHLIQHLLGVTAAEASAWAGNWLAAHEGNGPALEEITLEAKEALAKYTANETRRTLVEMTDPIGTPAESYLRSRGLVPPYPDCVKYLDNGRTGESAVVGVLTTADGETIGVQLLYIDPQGRKSVVKPQRKVLYSAGCARDQAAFRIIVAGSGEQIPTEGAPPLVLAEGLEDALSVAQAGAAREVWGFPGVGCFPKLKLSAGAAVVLFRDGDTEETKPEAVVAVAKAVNQWLLAKAKVRVVETPDGEDANSLLGSKGPEELRRLVAEAPAGVLDWDGEVVRLGSLNPTQYERERAAAAKRHGFGVGAVDRLVKNERARAKAVEEADDLAEAVYPRPIKDLGAVLEAALAETRRYVVASEHDLAAAVLWAAHTHFVHHETVYLPVSPKLAIQSPDRGCGKSTMLEVLGTLVPRPVTGSSITASVVFRLVEAKKPTLLLDEADRIIRSSNDDLIAILNSSHRRAGAYVWRTEEIAGQHVPTKFSTWGPCAFAGIRELPPTLQDRSVVIRLARAKPGEVTHHLRNGTSPALLLIKQKLARAAADMTHLPDPQLPPGLHNRAGDNWSPLFSVAAVAGGRWPGLVAAAALAGLAADQQEGTLVALLEGIRRAFGELAKISTRALLDFLLADDEYDWASANRGRPINEAWLRERLRNVIAPAADGKPGSERWGSGNAKERGYSRGRFEDAWVRYLPSSSAPQNQPVHPVHPVPPLKANGNSGPDEHVGTRPPSESTRSPLKSNGAGPDAEVGVAGCEDRPCGPEKPNQINAGAGWTGWAGYFGGARRSRARSWQRRARRRGTAVMALTVERALAAATLAGCTFRLAGEGVAVRGFVKVPALVADFLRERRGAVFTALGGVEQDRPCVELLTQLGASLVYCTEDAAAEAAIAEVIIDAGDKPIAIDFETTPRPEYASPVPLKMTVQGRPMKVQPRTDDKAGLDPHRSDPRLVQIYGGGARVVVIDMQRVAWAVLNPLWDRPLLAHNAAFELSFLAKRGIHPQMHCSMQAAGLLLGVRRRSLADACSAFLGLVVVKTHQRSDWGAATLSQGQLAYAAADAVLCRRLWEKAASELNGKGRDQAYRLQRNCLAAAAAMGLKGIAIDLDAHADLCARWSTDLADARQAWVEATGSPPPSRPADAAAYLEKVLPEEQLARWSRTSTGGLSTAADQLARVAHLPAVRPLLAIKKAEKLLSAFGPKLRRLVNPETGRLHPHYNVAGTKAGRWSASDPNIQQLPHDADTRRIIVAAPGNVLVGVDYSQMELRAAAWISGDAELTRAYAQGLDVHVETAAAIAGIEPEAVTKAQRAAAKAVNFGSIYGMSAKGLSAAAWSGYGIDLAEADAKLALDRFFDKYAGLRRWMRTHADQCKRVRRVTIGAGRVVESAWERYPLGYPQMCNLPVQGICADCMMRAIALVHDELPGVLVAMVHDELLAEVPEADADITVEILKSCLSRAFVATFPGAPAGGLVEAHVGVSWAEVH